MSGWDDSTPPAVGWGAQAVSEEVSYSAGFTTENGGYGGNEESAGQGGGGGDGACRLCGVEGHYARECPDKPANDGACFNCGEAGHNKADCPQPRVPRGNCRHCDKEGHLARDCPEKPAELCRNCNQEGHTANGCENNRYIDKSMILEKSAEEAWADLSKANDEDDFDAFKISLLEYMKACPESKFNDLETSFRKNGFNYYLFALEREIEYYECIVGPNGETNAKYTWTLNRSPKPRRSRAIAHRMAKTPEENLERLKYAGEVMNETKPFCYVCRTKGHSRKECEVEQAVDEHERVVLKCGNCSALDHRLRDCPEPRKPDFNPLACKNCHLEGHRAADCTVPRVADENTECRRCGGMGHFSKECPQGGGGVCYNCGEEGHRSSDCTNEKVMKCRNCDDFGHSAKECPKPKDITRVKCNNCGEMGHYSRNCNNEKPVEEGETNGVYTTADPTPSWSGGNAIVEPSWGAEPSWGRNAVTVADSAW